MRLHIRLLHVGKEVLPRKTYIFRSNKNAARLRAAPLSKIHRLYYISRFSHNQFDLVTGSHIFLKKYLTFVLQGGIMYYRKARRKQKWKED